MGIINEDSFQENQFSCPVFKIDGYECLIKDRGSYCSLQNCPVIFWINVAYSNFLKRRKEFNRE